MICTSAFQAAAFTAIGEIGLAFFIGTPFIWFKDLFPKSRENIIDLASFTITFGSACFYQIFCPLYVILKVNCGQQEREQKAQKNPYHLQPYQNPFFMVFFIIILAARYVRTCLTQILDFLLKDSSGCDPEVVMIAGLVNVYLYLFTKNVDFNDDIFGQKATKGISLNKKDFDSPVWPHVDSCCI